MDGFTNSTKTRYSHGGAVARGNRMQAEEAGESRVIQRSSPPPARRAAPPARSSGPAPATTPLDTILSTVPSKRGKGR